MKQPSTNKQSPDFLVIGAMKCGTTSLQRYLECHPDIAMAPKELNFFSVDDNWYKGIDWYRLFFPDSDKIQGEVCPGYSKRHLHGDVPKRIYSEFPDIKLIYILRDPVARIVSHFTHALGSDSTKRPREEIFEAAKANFVATSRYAYQLEHYLEYFDINQILVLTTERMARHRRETLDEIFRFVGADTTFDSDSFDQIFHDSLLKVRRNAIGRLFAKFPLLSGFEQSTKALIPKSLHKYAGRLLGSPMERPDLSNQQIEYLHAALADDIQRLQEITGYRFSEWSVTAEI